MAQRGRTKKSEAEVREVFRAFRNTYDLPEHWQLTYHQDGRVSVFSVSTSETGQISSLTPVIDHSSGNAFVDSLLMAQVLLQGISVEALARTKE